MDFTRIEQVLEEINELEIVEDLSYYTIHLGLPLWRLFGGQWSGVPYYLKTICSEVDGILHQSEVSLEEILLFLANSEENTSYFFVCRNLLFTNTGIKLNESEMIDILSFKKKLPDEVVIDKEKIIVL